MSVDCEVVESRVSVELHWICGGEGTEELLVCDRWKSLKHSYIYIWIQQTATISKVSVKVFQYSQNVAVVIIFWLISWRLAETN